MDVKDLIINPLLYGGHLAHYQMFLRKNKNNGTGMVIQLDQLQIIKGITTVTITMLHMEIILIVDHTTMLMSTKEQENVDVKMRIKILLKFNPFLKPNLSNHKLKTMKISMLKSNKVKILKLKIKTRNTSVKAKLLVWQENKIERKHKLIYVKKQFHK